jgi:pantetheine-phosphate adenylyltransferase
MVVFPGSFDPFTLGHSDVVYKALKAFGEVRILVCYNPEKEGWISPEGRKELIESEYENDKRVSVALHGGLLVEYLAQKGIDIIVKGLRNTIDFEYEKIQAHANTKLLDSCETVFISSNSNLVDCSSSLVRQLAHFNRSPSSYISNGTIDYLQKKGKLKCLE